MFDAAPRRRPTATSAFGVGRRENHDASDFYARFTAPELSDDATVWEGDRAIDEIFCGDARSMGPEVPDNSVALVVTSPPYFAGKEYEQALGEGHTPATYLEFLRMLEDVFSECKRKLEPGGRMAVNIANLGRRPYRSLSSDVIHILQDRLGLLLRGEIIWQKARGAAANCAWGSFQRPANPVLRDLTERVIVASKGRFDRALSYRERERRKLPHKGLLKSDDFMEYTTDVWEMPPESASRVGHPAPFPIELPERLIRLYTYEGDLVLDPFMGSGTTAAAAVRTARHFAGYDTDPAYVDRAMARVVEERARREQVDVSIEPPSGLPPADEDEAFQARAVREGHAAKRIAKDLLERCGFSDIKANVRYRGGVEVNFRARDAVGRTWLFDVSGGFTSSRPGLKRTDTLWKALGKAAVLHATGAEGQLILLTTDLPEAASAGEGALQAVRGQGKPIRDVIRMLHRGDLQRLKGYQAGGT